jgi:hypothetical protein
MCNCPQCTADWDDDEPEDDCCHEEYEADILTGIACCTSCGERWMQSPEECQRERERQAEYDKMCLEWEAEQARDFDPAACSRAMIGEHPQPPPADDELPF